MKRIGGDVFRQIALDECMYLWHLLWLLTPPYSHPKGLSSAISEMEGILRLGQGKEAKCEYFSSFFFC